MTNDDLLWADWPAPAKIRALTTTRAGGVSELNFESLNLADHVDDDIARVNENRQRLCQHLKIPPPLWLKQVHGIKVANAQMATRPVEADAIVSFQAGVACAVMTADCLPLLFCNQSATKVAAAHAGWRGLANGVIEATVEAMQENSNALMVWLGPAIGPQQFEVGQDVFDTFVKYDREAEKAFVQTDDTHFLADIYQLARQRLKKLGIEAVYGGGLCTYSDEDRFYSFRRNPVTGRMASLIWIEE